MRDTQCTDRLIGNTGQSSPERSPLTKSGNQTQLAAFHVLARFLARCERAALGRSHLTPPMEAKKITELTGTCKDSATHIVKLASATLAKSDSNGRLKCHFECGACIVNILTAK